ncbi:DUF1559 domain-containing protein [Blastopirellula marina]|uniref:Prepilin-type cleavage/methylation domain-containing protein n=1 Tax=Blastopirellula marina TaxID=124 RepID=A0A2S8G333_9BACT|nr:DUF1559 domain-containing protein [Blastopirellula marina]PQO38671.1 prepilin-type cleavage/methylation domain-containing protein [Blastopirellula marina]PTL45329.1 DUF1559 domain-containing protein [Blastopirellula marina]
MVRKHGFTLVELLVVIAIIGVLIALLLPAVQQAREAARRMQCSNYQKQIGLALHNYNDTFRKFPPGVMSTSETSPVTSGPQQWGWLVFLLPQLEQGNFFDRLAPNQRTMKEVLEDTNPNDGTPDRTIIQTELEIFRCPSDTTGKTLQGTPQTMDLNGDGLGAKPGTDFFGGTSNYVAAGGYGNLDLIERPSGPFFPNSDTSFKDITDGSTNTFAAGERCYDCSAAIWAGTRNQGGQGPRGNNYVMGTVKVPLNYTIAPTGVTGCPIGFSSKHPGGAMFTMCDGSVRFISENIDFNNSDANVSSSTPGVGNFNRINLGIYQKLGIMNDDQVLGNF